MNYQEMFDTVARALLKQGVASYGVFDERAAQQMGQPRGCLYRGPEGRKCAMGWLIPDDQYNQRMEGEPASIVADKLGWEGDDNLWSFLNSLQMKHDNYMPGGNDPHATLDGWRDEMREVANEYHLSAAVLDEAA